MKISLIAVLAAVVLAASSAPLISPAKAEESGFASIHTWRKVGKKTCLVGHQHAGNGSGNSLKAAQLQAVNAWSSFTNLEYGSSWSSFGNAVEKIMKCSPSAGSFQCDLLATPCRGW
jgi:hypothetical protein